MKKEHVTYQGLFVVLVPHIQADLIWDFTFVFIALGVAYLLFIFVFRNRISQRSAMVKARKKELGPMISTFLFYEDDASGREKKDYFNLKLEIRQLLKDEFNRKVLVEVLLDLQKDIAGEARHRLSLLYRNLGLHLYALDSLKSRHWEVVCRGILELTQLQVEEAYGFIKHFINHPKGVIRKQAQLAAVSLKHEGIAYFLDTNKYRISEWQQLKLLDVIRNLEDFQPPRFRSWLTSKNRDVVLFALRLIKYYKQNDARASIIELVKHKNEQIKMEAVSCIKEFCFGEALETMKAVFWGCSAELKIQLLDAIANLGSEAEIEFLKMVENKENKFIVKSKALSAINFIFPESVLPTIDIENTKPYQAFDPRVEEPSDIPEAPPSPTLDAVIHGEPGTGSDVPSAVTETPDLIGDPQENEIVRPPEQEKSATTYGWEELLDTETDNEELFDICFMEELQDILLEQEESEMGADPCEFLPLDFLPVVTDPENPSEEQLWRQALPEAILRLDVRFELVSEEEKFGMELEHMLNRLRDPDEQGEAALPDPSVVGDDALRDSGGTEVAAEERSDMDQPPGRQGMDLHTEGPATEDFGLQPAGDKIEHEQTESRPEEVLPGDTSSDPHAIQFEMTTVDGHFHRIDKTTEDGGEDNPDADVPDPGQCSVFFEFFRNADPESKLILLDEVLPVGDWKELSFLEGLTEDPDKRVRIKAETVRHQLLEKLKGGSGEKSEATPWEGGSQVSAGAGSDLRKQGPGATGGKKELIPLEYCFIVEGAEPVARQWEGFMFEPDFEHSTDLTPGNAAIEDIPPAGPGDTYRGTPASDKRKGNSHG